MGRPPAKTERVPWLRDEKAGQQFTLKTMHGLISAQGCEALEQSVGPACSGLAKEKKVMYVGKFTYRKPYTLENT